MLFGKYINKYYKKYGWFFLLGVLALVVVDVAQTFIPRYLGRIIDEDNQLIADLNELGGIALGILGCAGIMFVGRVVWRLAIFRASTGIATDLREEMFVHAEKLDAAYYSRNKVGNVMNWFTGDIEEISEFFGWGTVMLVDAVFLSASVIISMLRLSVWMTLLCAIPILLIVVWGALVERFMSSKWEGRQAAFDRLYDFANENFTGIRVIKSFVKANQEIHAFAKIAKENKDVNVNFARISVLFDVMIQFILIAQMALLLGIGGYFVYGAVTGNPISIFGNEIKLTAGHLMEFVGYVDLLIWPMIALGQIVTMHSRAKGSLHRISEFLDASIDVYSPLNAVKLDGIAGRIEFRDFSFTYPGAQNPSLQHVNATIEAGEHVGIVGKVGSGKSTFVNALFRLYNIDKGTVFIDGVDLMDADIASLRNEVAYAPQNNFLYSDAIFNNIAFGGHEPDMERVLRAADFADVARDIDGFPNGYDTVTGERGVTLSGGQKQRVSIARAYYKDSPILVLDDCVSAVDLSTEETILHNIATRRAGRTTLLIASRVSSVVHMDKILVFDQGKLIASGKHEELVRDCPLYARMVALQELEKAAKGGEGHE